MTTNGLYLSVAWTGETASEPSHQRRALSLPAAASAWELANDAPCQRRGPSARSHASGAGGTA